MDEQPTAPTCIVEACDELSALSSIATDTFFIFTTFYCSRCYEKLLNGEDLAIDASRIAVERHY